MELTFIGLIQLGIGLALVVAGSLRAMFLMLLLSGLFAGSAAILLPALGGSTIPPAILSLVFVYLRMLLPGSRHVGTFPESIRANWLLVLFTLYGVAAAILAPRIFAGQIDVAPMRIEKMRGLFTTVPLEPSTQNINSAVYLVGVLLVALAAYALCRHSERGGAALISAGIVVGWCHILLGLLVLAARGTPLQAFFEEFRNGGYAQLDQTYQGFIRIRGLFPESSAFAEFGFAYFVLNAELWYRSIRPKETGRVAFALAAILFFSTSSTAYVGLLAYLLAFVLRLVALPGLGEWHRVRQLLLAALALASAGALALLLSPDLFTAVSDMVVQMTVGKAATSSGVQRLFWALQGWDAFKASFGLGIGPGSFRSSSLVMAIVGSMGVIGLGTFLAYLVQVLAPWRRSTYARTADLGQTIGGAFAAAAVLSLVPAAVSSAKSDPGNNFAFMAGAALALRSARRRPDADSAGAARP